MATKIVLNKKNAKDDYGILNFQFFNVPLFSRVGGMSLGLDKKD